MSASNLPQLYVKENNLTVISQWNSNDLTHGWRSSAVISQWLDVPEISIRNWYLPHLMKNPDDLSYLFKAPQGHTDMRK